MSNTSSSVTVTEVLSHPSVPAKTAWGGVLADQPYFATVKGTAADETFDVADLSARTQALMGAHKRGVTVDMGAGNDNIVGSAYGDTIAAGAGVNYVDGGANQGSTPGGAAALDVLDVFVADAAAAAAVAVFSLDPHSSGVDGAAFAGGYKFKVTNGHGETTYVKNVEQVNVRLESDRSSVKAFSLALDVHETTASADQLATQAHFAIAMGSAMGDIFNAATGISSVTQAKMDAFGRGVQVDTGAGDDRISGSAYGDYIIAGAGINHIDGAANGGSTPSGVTPQDVLQITVSSSAAANAVQVLALAGSSDAADIDAALAGYSYKVIAPGETDYIKGIERVSVAIFDGTTLTFVRDILLAARVTELDAPNMSDYQQIAWVDGTAGVDIIDLASGNTLLSASLADKMASGRQGAWIDGGGGDDTITGTAYTDIIRNGDGNARIDGGANQTVAGLIGKDIFEITVATQADLDALVVSASDDPLYTWMVTYGAGSTQKDYLRNVEGINAFAATGGGKWIALSMEVHALSGPDLSGYAHLVWAQGTTQDDTFDAATDISAATLALMDSYGRGANIMALAGNDTIKGSAYGDQIDGGAGTNYIDGGANGGLAPSGALLPDILIARAASKADFDAANVEQLSSASTGADLAAFNNGYLFKLVNGTSEVDYFKNIEQVQIEYWTDANANGQYDTGEYGNRSITMTVGISGTRITGTAFGDRFVAATDLSADTLALMATTNSGISANMGAGDDTIVGSAYQDNINAGSGINYIDGGAQGFIDGGTPRDNLAVTPLTQADFDAFAVTELSAASTGADLAAFNSGYTFKVTSGAAETDYLKNVEGVTVQFWNDLNGNGRRDSGETRSKVVNLALEIFEERLDPANPGYLVDGGPIAEVSALAHVTGTPFADIFDVAINLSATGRALMDSVQLGLNIDTRAGNDIIKTSAYADKIIAGTGVNHIDGGAGVDTLDVYVTSQAAALALAVQTLSAASTGVDAAAFAAGYLYKLDAGAEVDYLLNVEQVRVYLWNDKNGDGRVTHAAAGSTTNEATLVVTLIGNPDPVYG